MATETMNSSTVSFRISEDLHGWLEHAAPLYRHESDLVALILRHAVEEQSNRSGYSLLDGLLDNQQVVGGSLVVTIRLPLHIKDSISMLAARHNKTPSQFCSVCLLAWYEDYRTHYLTPGWELARAHQLQVLT